VKVGDAQVKTGHPISVRRAVPAAASFLSALVAPRRRTSNRRGPGEAEVIDFAQSLVDLLI
jgi:hypothetical protein